MRATAATPQPIAAGGAVVKPVSAGPAPARPLLAGNLITVASMMLWATSFPATEILLRTWHPLLLTTARLGIASLTLLTVMAATGKLRELRTAPWRDVVLLGATGIAGSVTLLVWGQRFADPVTVAILGAATPLISLVMGIVGRVERLTLPVALGIVLAIAGGALVSIRTGAESTGFRGGELLVLGSLVCWTWYSRAAMSRLAGMSDLAKGALPTLVATVTVATAAAVLAMAGIIEPSYDLSPRNIGLVVWMGTLGVGMSLFLWLVGARMLGVTIASLHMNLVPFYVMLLALAGGMAIEGRQLLGAILVVLAAVLAQLPLFRRKRATASA